MELFTVKETAQMLRVSPITVRRYIASGELSAHRVGRGIRVKRQDVEDFLEPVMPAGRPFTLDDPLWNIDGIGSPRERENIAEHKDEYKADAILASSSDEEDYDVASVLRGQPISRDDPLYDFIETGEWNGANDVVDDSELPTMHDVLKGIIAIGRSEEPTDIAAFKDEYIADAVMPTQK